MRPATDVDAEGWVLTSSEGRELLAAVAGVTAPGPKHLERWRRLAPAEAVAAAIRLLDGRKRGAAKFARADRMWFEPTALEQSTAEPVARHKAVRFGGGVVVDLCAGIGGDSLALASGADVLAVDADRGMCRRLLWNAEVYGVAGRVAAIEARAEAFGLPGGARVHIDPDRRAHSTTRARSVADYAPGLDFLQRLPRRAAGGAIKLGPASDFATYFGSTAYEVELVSLGGECKEATVWFGDLVSCHRRATILPGGVTWTDRDGPDSIPSPPAPLSAWVYDPDPALCRSGLLDAFAEVHGLRRCASGIDFLTAPVRVASPFLATFEVLEVFPLDLKILKRVVADRNLGPLEIKPKGLDIRPEAIRGQLRPRGSQSASLLLIGGDGPARAVLARRG